jgi:hypothetical protein
MNLLIAAFLHAAVLQSAPRAPEPSGKHGVYFEALGRGGLWGLGYDYEVHPRILVGSVFSYSALRGDHVAVLAPYVGAHLVKRRRHRFSAHLGPQLVFVRTPAPVPEWTGQESFGISASLSIGYEYRRHVLFRVALLGNAGKGGVSPWLGLSLGWAR